MWACENCGQAKTDTACCFFWLEIVALLLTVRRNSKSPYFATYSICARSSEAHPFLTMNMWCFRRLAAAWLNLSIVRTVALLSAAAKRCVAMWVASSTVIQLRASRQTKKCFQCGHGWYFEYIWHYDGGFEKILHGWQVVWCQSMVCLQCGFDGNSILQVLMKKFVLEDFAFTLQPAVLFCCFWACQLAESREFWFLLRCFVLKWGEVLTMKRKWHKQHFRSLCLCRVSVVKKEKKGSFDSTCCVDFALVVIWTISDDLGAYRVEYWICLGEISNLSFINYFV